MRQIERTFYLKGESHEIANNNISQDKGDLNFTGIVKKRIDFEALREYKKEAVYFDIRYWILEKGEKIRFFQRRRRRYVRRSRSNCSILKIHKKRTRL